MNDARIVAFRDALADGDHVSAIERFDDYDDALDSQSIRERALRNLARGIVAHTDADSSDNRAAQELVRVITDAQQARIKSKFEFMLYLEGGPDAEHVAGRVQDVLDAHESVATAEERIRSLDADVSLPVLLGLYGPRSLVVPKGTTFDATYTIENVGITDASDLDVLVQGYDVSVDPSTIESLAVDASADITVTGDADRAADTFLLVNVGSESSRTALVVLAKADYLDQTLAQLDRFEATLAELDEVLHRPIRPFQRKIGTVRRELESMQTDLENGRIGARRVNNEIHAVNSQLGGLYGLVNSLQQVSAVKRESLKSELDAVGDLLDEATEAAI